MYICPLKVHTPIYLIEKGAMYIFLIDRRHNLPCSLASKLWDVRISTKKFGLQNTRLKALRAKKLHNKSARPTIPHTASVRTGWTLNIEADKKAVVFDFSSFFTKK